MQGKIQQLRQRIAQENAVALSYRKELFEAERELQMRSERIKDLKQRIYFSPLPEADKLLRLIDEIVAQTVLNQYELRCWRDDYVQYKRKCAQ